MTEHLKRIKNDAIITVPGLRATGNMRYTPMNFRLRSLLWGVGIPLGLVGLLFLLFALLASDTLTFTSKTASYELPHGKTLNLYRTARFESYDCHFEVLDSASGEILTPKTHFYGTLYMSHGDSQHMNTPEGRTTFIPLIGENSGLVGLVSQEEPEVVVLVLDVGNGDCVIPWARHYDTDVAAQEKALEKLRKDFPKRQLAFK